MRNRNKVQNTMRKRRNSDGELPRTKSAVFLPKMNKLRGKEKFCSLENAGKRTLFAQNGRVRASLPNPPFFKMMPMVKNFVDSEEIEKYSTNCSVLIRQMVNGKLQSSSTTIFRDKRLLANCTIYDGYLYLNTNCKSSKSGVVGGKSSRKKMGSFSANGYAKSIRTRVESNASQESDNQSKSSKSKSFKTRFVEKQEYPLSRLISIKISKTKKTGFSLLFYAKEDKTKNKEHKSIPNMVQINFKVDSSLIVESFLGIVLDNLKYLIMYNEKLITQFKTSVVEGQRDLSREKDRTTSENIEKLMRLNLDMKCLVYGENNKETSREFANFSIYLSNSGKDDDFDESSYWQQRALSCSSNLVKTQEDDILTCLQKRMLQQIL